MWIAYRGTSPSIVPDVLSLRGVLKSNARRPNLHRRTLGPTLSSRHYGSSSIPVRRLSIGLDGVGKLHRERHTRCNACEGGLRHLGSPAYRMLRCFLLARCFCTPRVSWVTQPRGMQL